MGFDVASVLRKRGLWMIRQCAHVKGNRKSYGNQLNNFEQIQRKNRGKSLKLVTFVPIAIFLRAAPWATGDLDPA